MTQRSSYLKRAKPAPARPINTTVLAQNIALALFVAVALAVIAKSLLV